MANSYGFDGNIPEHAGYGVYDADNGEWVGRFFCDLESAQAEANDLGEHGYLVVMNVRTGEELPPQGG